MLSFRCSIHLFHKLFFSGMKVYVTDEKELIMEPCLKWAGNPNVTVAVKAFGLKATAQVVAFFSSEGNCGSFDLFLRTLVFLLCAV